MTRQLPFELALICVRGDLILFSVAGMLSIQRYQEQGSGKGRFGEEPAAAGGAK